MLAASVTWESAALVGAVGTLLAALSLFVQRVISAMRDSQAQVIEAMQREGSRTRDHTAHEVVKANGATLAFLENSPFPAWYKSANGVMRYINPAYSVAFGVRPDQYVNRRDRDVWPADIAEAFGKNDDQVVRERVRCEFHEYVPDRVLDPASPRERWFVTKFPVIDPTTREVKGVGGFCVPEEYQSRAAGQTGTWRTPHGMPALFAGPRAGGEGGTAPVLPSETPAGEAKP